MLPAELRLRDSDSFRRAVRGGRRSGSSALVVHLAPADPAPTAPSRVGPGAIAPVPGARDLPATPRFGLVVSRAVGNAVTRNRVKRRLRHLLRDRVGSVPPGSLVVVRALAPAAGLSSAELRVELDRCLVRATRRTSSGSAS